MLLHDFCERQGSGNIIGIIFHGFLHRFPDSLISGKVNDRIDFLFRKNTIQSFAVFHICFIEDQIFPSYPWYGQSFPLLLHCFDNRSCIYFVLHGEEGQHYLCPLPLLKAFKLGKHALRSAQCLIG